MTELVPDTEARVEVNTDQEINERIRRELEARVYYYAQRPSEIENRLRERIRNGTSSGCSRRMPA